MAHWLRALACLLEGRGLNSSTHKFTSVCNSSSRGSDALFWPQRTLKVPGAQTYMQAKHPGTIKKESWVVVVHTVNPSIWEAGAGRALNLRQAWSTW